MTENSCTNQTGTNTLYGVDVSSNITTNPNQELVSYGLISQYAREALDRVSVSSIEDPLARAYDLFGEDAARQLVDDLNNFVSRNRGIIDTQKGLEELASRFGDKSPKKRISQSQAFAFVNTYAFPVVGFLDFANANLNGVLTALNRFFGPSLASKYLSGIKESTGVPFTDIQTKKEFVEQYKSLLGSEVAGFDTAQQQALLNVRKKTHDLVDELFDGLRKTTETFQLSNSGAASFSKGVLDVALKEKEKALRVFSKANQTYVKEAFDANLAYALSLFDNKTPELTNLLVARFSTVGGVIEKTYESVFDNLKSIYENIATSQKKITTASNANTAQAASFGAVRLTPEERQARIARMQTVMGRNPNASEVSFTNEEVFGMTLWKDGKGDDRLRFSSSLSSQEGWEGLSFELRVRLMRAQAVFGKTLVLVRGYDGSAKESVHRTGTAADVTWEGFNAADASLFVDIAKAQGFRGFGYSNKYLHIDLGPAREWNI